MSKKADKFSEAFQNISKNGDEVAINIGKHADDISDGINEAGKAIDNVKKSLSESTP